MFTRSSMSPETNEVMNSLVDDLYGDLVNTIAKGRGKDAAAIRAIIDDGPFLAKQAKANGLVDELRYEDQVFGELKTTLHQTDLKKITEHDYVNVPDTAVGLGRQRPDRVCRRRRHHHARRSRTPTLSDNGLESEAFDKMLDRVGERHQHQRRDRAHRFAGRRSDGFRRYVARHE